MFGHADVVKEKLSESISQLSEVSWMFAKDPKRNFTRKRKLPFEKVISFLLAMEGSTLTSEFLKYFGCSGNTASSSALVQQRSKIDPSAFSSLFDLFVHKTDQDSRYRNFLSRTQAHCWFAPLPRKKGGVHIPGGLCQTDYVQLH